MWIGLVGMVLIALNGLAGFLLGHRLGGRANRNRIEIKYPESKVEVPSSGQVLHRTEADLAKIGK